MASLTIRKLDESTKAKLRIRAAHNRRSMEEEARAILREALAMDALSATDLVDVIQGHFKPLGGIELQLPRRGGIRKPPRFGTD